MAITPDISASFISRQKQYYKNVIEWHSATDGSGVRLPTGVKTENLMKELVSKHYDDKYYDWQSSIGEFGGWANRTKFAEYISSNSDVLDFGCGGGFLLEGLQCKKKVGVEVNKSAAEEAKKKELKYFLGWTKFLIIM